jgi:hypothetical protein
VSHNVATIAAREKKLLAGLEIIIFLENAIEKMRRAEWAVSWAWSFVG